VEEDERIMLQGELRVLVSLHELVPELGDEGYETEVEGIKRLKSFFELVPELGDAESEDQRREEDEFSSEGRGRQCR
jgi:hypothetical protein